jgi:hypothetical protein
MDERISLSPSFYHIHTIHWFPDIEVMGGPFVVYCFLNQPSKTTASRCDIHTPPPLGGQSRATDQNPGKDVVLMAVMAGQILSGWRNCFPASLELFWSRTRC